MYIKIKKINKNLMELMFALMRNKFLMLYLVAFVEAIIT
jgi:hypothetical protein